MKLGADQFRGMFPIIQIRILYLHVSYMHAQSTKIKTDAPQNNVCPLNKVDLAGISRHFIDIIIKSFSTQQYFL